MVNWQNQFGFETVDPQQKTHKVQQIFSQISSKYDLMNDVMSLGLQRYWKKLLVEKIALKPEMAMIDVAGGTGDIAIQSYKRLRKIYGAAQANSACSIIVCDLNPQMLQVGREKAINQGILKQIEWVNQNAESLSFSDHSFDVYTIAFGLRNITNMEAAIAEAWRVLKPGGRLICLEFGKIDNETLRKIYNLYSFKLIPLLGSVIADNRSAYQYLVESIATFPPPETICSMMRNCGFESVQTTTFSRGIAIMYISYK